MDELILFLQRWADRLIRRLRLGPAPPPGGRRGIMEGGSCYGCVFTGGECENLA